jgi:hypothetical protein
MYIIHVYNMYTHIAAFDRRERRRRYVPIYVSVIDNNNLVERRSGKIEDLCT